MKTTILTIMPAPPGIVRGCYIKGHDKTYRVLDPISPTQFRIRPLYFWESIANWIRNDLPIEWMLFKFSVRRWWSSW